jgi:hypothetical protein
MRTVIHRPSDLFEAEEPPTALLTVQKSQMLPLLKAKMLIEVSTATAVREADYDEGLLVRLTEKGGDLLQTPKILLTVNDDRY